MFVIGIGRKLLNTGNVVVLVVENECVGRAGNLRGKSRVEALRKRRASVTNDDKATCSV